MTPIQVPPFSDRSWDRARVIVKALRAKGKSNAFIVAAICNALAESGWRAVIVGDHSESFGPWQCKWTFYGPAILEAINVDIRTEPDLAKQTEAVLYALSMPANAKTLAAIEAAQTGEEATRAWAAGFERASAGGAVERRTAISGRIEVWLNGEK